MLRGAKEFIRAWEERTVPARAGPWGLLGLFVLAAFLLQVLTGVLLMAYYRPSADAAHLSTGIIMDEVRFGWLVRGLHRWGSDLVILLSSLHLAQVYWSRAYRSPRELTWVIGIFLLVAMLAFGFTGTLLPWDQYAYWYIDSARETIAGVPLVRTLLLGVIWGGWEIGEEVLLRFYALHVGVLPWLAVVLLGVHLAIVWRWGIEEPLAAASGRGVPLADLIARLAIVIAIGWGVLFSFAVVVPPALLEPADPLSPLSPALAQPRWYLMPVRQLVHYLPGWRAALVAVALLAALLSIPAVDRRPALRGWGTAVHRALAALVAAGWLWLGASGYWR